MAPSGDWSNGLSSTNLYEQSAYSFAHSGGLTNGTPNDGIYKLKWNWKSSSINGNLGVWTLLELRVKDKDYSEVNFSPTCLRERGFNIDLTVVP
jgi:hypothetical protein